MNAFLSLNPLSLKLAESCSALPRVVRSLSTSREGNCREIVSFPHPASFPVNHITKELCQEQRCKNAPIMEFQEEGLKYLESMKNEQVLIHLNLKISFNQNKFIIFLI